MIQRNVPGIGPYVLPAYLFAAVPAVLAGLAYAMLASAMPRAGGSYVYASRALSPYLGFIASFSQWFSLSIAIGVVSYLLVPFLRDTATAIGWTHLAQTLDTGAVRVTLALAALWTAVAINALGVRAYERVIVPLMFLTFLLGGIVIVVGFHYDHAAFAAAVARHHGAAIPPPPASSVPFTLRTFLPAAALLFSSFIGFDSIAQAGGEARDPSRSLPLAIGIAVVVVGTFYMLFTGAVYHSVPWQYIAAEAAHRDLTAPGLLGELLPRPWTVAIVAGAAVALAKDLPAMLLAVSRLMFAWAEDGIVPRGIARLHPTRRTPVVAILLSALMASASIAGSHLAGDFFVGVDILVTSMLVNFLLMSASVLTLPHRNPALARQVRVLPQRAVQVPLAVVSIVILGGFLAVHTWKDLTVPARAWYFHSTAVWLILVAVATIVYVRERAALRQRGVDLRALFATLPLE
jgi:basic amino acid/polyamine antiporter, APA family